ncbi:hypothetical protein ACET9N_13155 [Aeromonas veronii]
MDAKSINCIKLSFLLIAGGYFGVLVLWGWGGAGQPAGNQKG